MVVNRCIPIHKVLGRIKSEDYVLVHLDVTSLNIFRTRVSRCDSLEETILLLLVDKNLTLVVSLLLHTCIEIHTGEKSCRCPIVESISTQYIEEVLAWCCICKTVLWLEAPWLFAFHFQLVEYRLRLLQVCNDMLQKFWYRDVIIDVSRIVVDIRNVCIATRISRRSWSIDTQEIEVHIRSQADSLSKDKLSLIFAFIEYGRVGFLCLLNQVIAVGDCVPCCIPHIVGCRSKLGIGEFQTGNLMHCLSSTSSRSFLQTICLSPCIDNTPSKIAAIKTERSHLTVDTIQGCLKTVAVLE